MDDALTNVAVAAGHSVIGDELEEAARRLRRAAHVYDRATDGGKDFAETNLYVMAVRFAEALKAGR